MDWQEIKNKSVKELNELLSELRYDLHSLGQQAHNRQLKQVHKIGEVKQAVARILTQLEFLNKAAKENK